MVGTCMSNCVLYRSSSMKVKLVSAVRKWTVILNSAGGMRDCWVVRESGGYAFCLSPRNFCPWVKTSNFEFFQHEFLELLSAVNENAQGSNSV